MALKRPQDMMASFSMASMTDVIFLLLVFFMVTSTYVFPTAIEVNLPEGVEQVPDKPSTRVFVDKEGSYFVSIDKGDLAPVPADSLVNVLQGYVEANPDNAGIAVYADVEVAYGKVVDVLNLGAANSLKMVLATRPSAASEPASAASAQSSQQQSVQ